MDKSTTLSKDECDKITEFKNCNKGILLEHYVNSGDIDTIRLLLKHYPECVDIYNTDYFGETPLFNATESKKYEISKLLLESEANVDAANFEDNTTPLMNSCFNVLLQNLQFTTQSLGNSQIIMDDFYPFEKYQQHSKAI